MTTTKRDTIDMAREAGLFTHKEVQAELKAFEALVRADEREACAKVCEVAPSFRSTLDGPSIRETIGKQIAAAIRARGNT